MGLEFPTSELAHIEGLLRALLWAILYGGCLVLGALHVIRILARVVLELVKLLREELGALRRHWRDWCEEGKCWKMLLHRRHAPPRPRLAGKPTLSARVESSLRTQYEEFSGLTGPQSDAPKISWRRLSDQTHGHATAKGEPGHPTSGSRVMILQSAAKITPGTAPPKSPPPAPKPAIQTPP